VSISIHVVFEIFVLVGQSRAMEMSERERRRCAVLLAVHHMQDGKERSPFANSTANYVPTSRGFTPTGICCRGFACHPPLGIVAELSFKLFQSCRASFETRPFLSSPRREFLFFLCFYNLKILIFYVNFIYLKICISNRTIVY